MSRAADRGRRRRLHRISADGVFALVAVDHRDSLKVAFEARGVAALEGQAIGALKAEIVAALAPAATGVLIDAEHAASAEAQLEVVTAAVEGCHAAGLPLAVEPIVYRLPDEDEAAHADAFPGLVVAGVERLIALGVDVMKVHFPRAGAAGAEEEWCRQLDAACGATPWVLLGGGAAYDTFAEQVEVACRAGASGYIVGRTAWDGAVTADAGERRRWLADVGAPRLRAMRERAAALARPFTSRVPALARYAPDWYSRA